MASSNPPATSLHTDTSGGSCGRRPAPSPSRKGGPRSEALSSSPPPPFHRHRSSAFGPLSSNAGPPSRHRHEPSTVHDPSSAPKTLRPCARLLVPIPIEGGRQLQ